MMEPFSALAVLQFRVRTGAPEENITTIRRLLATQPLAGQSLVVLPELWATGFAYDRFSDLAEATPQSMQALSELAARKGVLFAGTMLEQDLEQGGAPFNTLYLIGPEGVVGQQRKQRLFVPTGEDQHFQAGREAGPMTTPFGPVGALVCYDLRFPELARRQAFAGCPLLVVSAQWPAARTSHWQTLLKARAIENQVYVAAANCCGGSSDPMAGHSMVLAPDGGVLASLAGEEGVCSAPYAAQEVDQVRQRFCSIGERPWQGRDQDKILTLPQLTARLARLRHPSTRIAFTNGCFDLLHSGHVSYLEQARRQADLLVVGLNSDRSVRGLKGEGRPVNHEQDRARVLAALGCVDFVVLFEEPTPLELIVALEPHVLVKGADWPLEQIVGAAEVIAAGGRVERVVFEHAVSTTALIEKIHRTG